MSVCDFVTLATNALEDHRKGSPVTFCRSIRIRPMDRFTVMRHQIARLQLHGDFALRVRLVEVCDPLRKTKDFRSSVGTDAVLMRPRHITQASVLRVDRIKGKPQRGHIRRSQAEVVIVLVRWSAVVSARRLVEPFWFLSVTFFTNQFARQLLPARPFSIGLEERIAAHVLQLLKSLRPGLVLKERNRVRQSRNNIADVPIQFVMQFSEVRFGNKIADNDKAVAGKVTFVLWHG